jgi:hypothetical protein
VLCGEIEELLAALRRHHRRPISAIKPAGQMPNSGPTPGTLQSSISS